LSLLVAVPNAVSRLAALDAVMTAAAVVAQLAVVDGVVEAC